MKKMLSICLLLICTVCLVACGSKRESTQSTVQDERPKQTLEGTYYEFYEGKSDLYVVSSIYPFVIKEYTVEVLGGEFEIDKDKQIIYYKGEAKSYVVDSQTGVVTFDGNTYVKAGSDYYQQLLDEGAKEV